MSRPSNNDRPESSAEDTQPQRGGNPEFLRQFHLRNLQRAAESAMIRYHKVSLDMPDLSRDNPYTYDVEYGFKVICLLWKWIHLSGQGAAITAATPKALRLPSVGTQWELGYCPLRTLLRNIPREPLEFKSPKYLIQLRLSAGRLFQALTGLRFPPCATAAHLLLREFPEPSQRVHAIHTAAAIFWTQKTFQHALATTEEKYIELFGIGAGKGFDRMQYGLNLSGFSFSGTPEPARPSEEAASSPTESVPKSRTEVDIHRFSILSELVGPIYIEAAAQQEPAQESTNEAAHQTQTEESTDEVASQMEDDDKDTESSETVNAEDLQEIYDLFPPTPPRAATPVAPAAMVPPPPTEPRADRDAAAAAAAAGGAGAGVGAAPHWNRNRNGYRGRGGYRGRRGGGAPRNGRNYYNGPRQAPRNQGFYRPAPRFAAPAHAPTAPAPTAPTAPASGTVPVYDQESAWDEAAVSAAWDEPHLHWSADEDELNARVRQAFSRVRVM